PRPAPNDAVDFERSTAEVVASRLKYLDGRLGLVAEVAIDGDRNPERREPLLELPDLRPLRALAKRLIGILDRLGRRRKAARGHQGRIGSRGGGGGLHRLLRLAELDVAVLDQLLQDRDRSDLLADRGRREPSVGGVLP